MRSLTRSSLILIGALVMGIFSGAAAAQGGNALKRLMSVKDFEACGLQKLTPAELANLERWLARVPTSASPVPSPAGAAAIESQIEGDFEGWDGETIFKLANGQIWQQASYAYSYHYAYRPKVTIYPAAGGHEMVVEGMSNRIRVKRLK